MPLEIVSLGTCNMDFIMKVPDFVEVDGEMYIENLQTSPGGSAFNFSANMSKLGLPSGLITWIGNDYWGNIIQNDLKNRGINSKRLKKIEYPTGKAFISVDNSGKRSIYSFLGANEKLKLTPEDTEYIKSSEMLHLTGIYWEVAQKAAKYAKKLSFAPGALLSSYGIEKLKPVLQNTDILFLNEKEVEILTGNNIMEGSKLLIDEGVSAVIITQGANGATLFVENKEIHDPVGKAKVVDTTGAGDAFAAGFVAKWISNKPWVECLHFANDYAKKCVGKMGPL
ncbi:carbohydrate kinase family protein [Methanobacterium alcaliphilum]|uniref:carbohydrate kinase family protein n=1 Tax=Methanobacterium alcaliphilum TaxID=392018 RepID=UPI00200B4802|nr:carbohydrate kinase family protein [Methanobacterium alcaliphilum]MCK9151232.1 carbohydrate kinase family protein [Methanobacterium alcaliphilum]